MIESPKNPNSLIVKPLNKAKLFVVTKAIANVVPKKAPKLVLGEKFEPRFFIGTYKLCDDGRRSGQLKMEVNESGEVTFFDSEKAAKYEVTGQIGTVKHSITFKVKVARDRADIHGLHVHRRRQSHRGYDEVTRPRCRLLCRACGPVSFRGLPTARAISLISAF